MPNINVFASRDIKYIAQKMIRLDAKAKANKTLAARMETVLYHVKHVAAGNPNAKRDRLVRSIASKELAHQHKLFQSVKGQNLPASVAEQMKQGCLDAFKKILALFQ